MPFVGLGLHFLVAIFFAAHAVRSGQNMYWLLILFSFPLLGSIVYFLVIYLPNSKLERGARRAVAAAVHALDPGRELREAAHAYDETPTAQNRMRLAAAHLDAGQPQEAAAHYQACLSGPFASDPEIRFGAARALFACGQYAQAVGLLTAMRASHPEYRAEPVALLLAQAYGAQGLRLDATREFEAAVATFGSFDSKAEYLIWALGQGERDLVARLHQEVTRASQRWSRHTRELNQPVLARLSAAYERARAQPGAAT